MSDRRCRGHLKRKIKYLYKWYAYCFMFFTIWSIYWPL